MDVPAKMRGMVLLGHGGPEMLAWREDLPVPQPGPGEVLVKVGASAVNNTDINTRIGWYSKSVRGDTASGAGGYGGAEAGDGAWSGALQFPRVQGADCCGRIVAVGAGVDEGRLGERVLLRPMYNPHGGPFHLETLGSERDGAFAEFLAIGAKDALKVESDLSDVELASFPCAYSTAEGMLARVQPRKGERVLITGASGGVGSAAIQLAARRGAEVVAVTSPSKADAVRALGAAEVLGRDDPLPEKSVEVVVDLVGGPRWPELVEALRPGGRYAVSGAIAGPIVELDLRTLYLHDLTFHGSTFQPDHVFADLVRYIERGEVAPVVAQVFALRDMAAAQEAFMAKGHVGKIGLEVA
ncbi:alcohol dehydrogenase family protein [Vannielia litorea]|uniref:NADPH:quinone reductase n=1 Tax=Vannielia litorea TaxID=1217970 RepID=A0A1N6H1U2_9RHOB|nr:alcohol dehydrogenase family protein [Vannielia litorea]SIO13647.1 NADPH:quinone reductase [Vannielia litorea]